MAGDVGAWHGLSAGQPAAHARRWRRGPGRCRTPVGAAAMIRALAVAIALMPGIALAVLTLGRQEHLAAITGASLPAWTQATADDAHLISGRAGPLPGPLAL